LVKTLIQGSPSISLVPGHSRGGTEWIRIHPKDSHRNTTASSGVSFQPAALSITPQNTDGSRGRRCSTPHYPNIHRFPASPRPSRGLPAGPSRQPPQTLYPTKAPGATFKMLSNVNAGLPRLFLNGSLHLTHRTSIAKPSQRCRLDTPQRSP
jgi:hypothetical protein